MRIKGIRCATPEEIDYYRNTPKARGALYPKALKRLGLIVSPSKLKDTGIKVFVCPEMTTCLKSTVY